MKQAVNTSVSAFTSAPIRKTRLAHAVSAALIVGAGIFLQGVAGVTFAADPTTTANAGGGGYKLYNFRNFFKQFK